MQGREPNMFRLQVMQSTVPLNPGGFKCLDMTSSASFGCNNPLSWGIMKHMKVLFQKGWGIHRLAIVDFVN